MATSFGQRDPFAEWEESNHLPAARDSSADPTELLRSTPPSARAANLRPGPVARPLTPGYSGEELELYRRHLRAKELWAAVAVGALGAVLGVAVFFLAFGRLAPVTTPRAAPHVSAPVTTERAAPAPQDRVTEAAAPGAAAPPEVSPFEGELEPLPRLKPTLEAPKKRASPRQRQRDLIRRHGTTR